jgi:hypothetical protein
LIHEERVIVSWNALLASPTATLQPARERNLRLARWVAREQVLDTDVLVKLWPMDTLATADETPVVSLRLRAMK